MADKARYIKWFKDISASDVPIVGGKNASLGEMYRELSKSGIKIPNGFAVTANAYRYLVEMSGKQQDMRKILKEIDKRDLDAFATKAHQLRDLVYKAPLPQDLSDEICAAYRRLCEEYGADTDVAIRSSATAEDLPTASFAGQQESYLNVRGEAQLLDSCRRCFASLFTDRAISYRIDQGFDHSKVALSIGVMKMVRSDLAASGVIFTLDTETGKGKEAQKLELRSEECGNSSGLRGEGWKTWKGLKNRQNLSLSNATPATRVMKGPLPSLLRDGRFGSRRSSIAGTTLTTTVSR